MRCAAAPGVLAEMAAIRDESFASTASKIGSTHPACTTGLSRDRFADGGDYLGGPAGQGLAGGGVVGAAVDEAGRVVVQDIATAGAFRCLRT